MKKTNETEVLLLDRQLCFPLYAAARKIVAAYTPVLKPLGLTYTQYLVMLVLWEKDGIGVGQLCARLRLDSGTLTPVLKKLEERSLLERRRSGKDERVVILTLTAQGRALREQALGIPEEVGRCLSLTPEEAGILYGLLYRIIDG